MPDEIIVHETSFPHAWNGACIPSAFVAQIETGSSKVETEESIYVELGGAKGCGPVPHIIAVKSARDTPGTHGSTKHQWALSGGAITTTPAIAAGTYEV
jgi:hypothetical protein